VNTTSTAPHQPQAAHLERCQRSSIGQRILDLLVAIPVSVLTLPLLVLLAMGSAISFRAWPFFSQTRVGHNGRPFWFVKIRSLPAATPTETDKYAIESMPNSAFGAFIRRTHLDELPQLWLVIAGRMSLVGPRPEMPALASAFDPDFAVARQRVRPGCTGLWQISPGATRLISEAPEYDLFYLAHSSVRFDLWIMYKTVRSMVTNGHARPLAPPLWTLRGVAADLSTQPARISSAVSEIITLEDADPCIEPGPPSAASRSSQPAMAGERG